jgi:Phosphotransferase enzyme family
VHTGNFAIDLLSCFFWLPGETVATAVSRQPERAEAVGVLVGHAQARLHRLSPAPYVTLLSTSWLTWKGPHDERILEHLKREEQAPCVIHLDFHPENVMIEDERISGVLDWTNAHLGDARADVARTETILMLDAGNPADPPLLHPESAVWVFARGWRRGYEEVAGALGDLSAWYAWAGSVMRHDLAHRYTVDDLTHVRRWTEEWHQRIFGREDR